MKKLVFLFALFAISCNPFENISEVKKHEEALKNPRFKELPEVEMYAFLNEVYLPLLDSLKIPKNIVVHPSVYKPNIFDETRLPIRKNWYSDRKFKIDLSTLPPPPEAYQGIDSSYYWDKNKLVNVAFVKDIEEAFNSRNKIILISKPFRDARKGTIIMQEFYTYFACCLCYPQQLFFLKTESGWKQIPPY